MPQQNGVSERLNRTLMEMARSMLSQAGLATVFWGEAVATAASIRNITSSSANGGKTPIEMLTGKIPYVGHLRCFGCEVWTFVSKRKKLDTKARRAILLRCLPHRNYRVWDIESKRVHHVRHVRINESVYPALENRPSEGHENDVLQKWVDDMDGRTSCDMEDINDGGTPLRDTNATIIPIGTSGATAEGQQNGSLSEDVLEGLTHYPATAVSDAPNSNHTHRYPERERRPPVRFGDDTEAISRDNNTALLVVGEGHKGHVVPKSLKEAALMKDSEQWLSAVDAEVAALRAKGAWEIKQVPPGMRTIDSRFVFALKHKADGSVDKYKARIVAKGFQEENVGNVYSPVVDFASVRLALALMGRLGGVVHQMDVKAAFLNGNFENDECIFLNPPKGLELGLKPGYALRLNKALYGLKEASKIWNKTWNDAMLSLGFGKLKIEECFYFLKHNGCMVWVLLYVDDVLVMGLSVEVVEHAKKLMKSAFEMTDLGIAKSFLGVEFIFGEHGVALRQSFFIRQILDSFGMLECKPANTPLVVASKTAKDRPSEAKKGIERYREAIGALLYISTRTRPDIAAAVGILSRHCESPSQENWIAVKRVMRYLKGTIELGLIFEWNKDRKMPTVNAYADADWAGDLCDRKSTSGTVVLVNGTPGIWKSRKQVGVALSSTEAEFIAMSECVKDVTWVRTMLGELNLLTNAPTTIWEDSQGAIQWSSSEKRAKHVDIRYFFVKDEARCGNIKVQYCPTDDMIADVFTKGTTRQRLEKMRNLLRVRDIC